ncbi:thiol-disulfide isomerase/thioredoxin [Thalassospira sp. MBR-102]|jgi:thiol-disulfide isomerase/thioredoxin
MKNLLAHMNLKLALAAVIILVAVAALTMVLFRSENNTSYSGTNNVTQTQHRSFVMHDVPRPLPGFGFEDAEGRSMTLSDFEGAVVLLNVWATWCVPCREEMPTLDALQAELGNSVFKVIALSIDRAGADVVQDFYSEIGIRHLDLFIDPTMKTTTALGIPGLPTTLLIDRNGRELGRLVGPTEWATAEMIKFLETHIYTD